MVDVSINLIIRIPEVNKGKANHSNLIGVVLKNTEHDVYRIGTKDGILKNFIASAFIITFFSTK